MENLMLRYIRRHLANLKNIRERSYRRYMELDPYSSFFLKPGACVNGNTYYNLKRPGEKKRSYLGNQDNPTVIRIQEARYLRKLVEVADQDIILMENFLEQYESISFASINEKLPKSYRNKKSLAARDKKRIATAWKSRMEKKKAKYPVYKPEELKHRTVDGKYVRSKSEGLIYNFLLEGGYTFVYELPLEGKTRLFYPDFSILSEIDYKTVIRIEHHGKMNDPGYRDNAEVREYDYWFNGYLPGRDVYFTYDDNHGNFDIFPIAEILQSRVRTLDSV